MTSVVEGDQVTFLLQEGGFFNPKNPLDRKKSHGLTHPWGRTVYFPYQKTIISHENQPWYKYTKLVPLDAMGNLLCHQSSSYSKLSHRLIEILPRCFFCSNTWEASTSADQSFCFPLEVPKMHHSEVQGEFQGPPRNDGTPLSFP